MPDPGSRGATAAWRILKLSICAALAALAALLSVVFLHAVDPSLAPVWAAEAALIALVGLSAIASACGLGLAYARLPACRRELLCLVGLTLVVFAAHAYVINSPPTASCITAGSNGCIMDEGAYYVPAASLMLNGTRCSLVSTGGAVTELPSACNLEHPFLGKAFIAAGMAILGEGDLGYRFFQALLGTLCVPLLFLVARRVSGRRRLSWAAAGLLSVDVMFFSQSGAGLIDVQQVFFFLLALVACFFRLKAWKFDWAVISGVFLGLAGLTKETAVFAALALTTYILAFGGGTLPERAKAAARLWAAVTIVFLVGMQMYDVALTGTNAVGQVQFIVSFGTRLTGPLLCAPAHPAPGLQTGAYFCKFPDDRAVATPILPADWLVYYTPVRYWVDPVCVGRLNVAGDCLGTFYMKVGYYGVTNMVVTWAVFAWVPLALYGLYRERRGGSRGETAAGEGRPPPNGSSAAAALALIWFAWCYLPYLIIQYVLGRVTYPFYIVPAIPALALGAACMVSLPRFPRWAALLFAAAALCFFVVYFPDKGFIPLQLRSAIDRQFLFQPLTGV